MRRKVSACSRFFRLPNGGVRRQMIRLTGYLHLWHWQVLDDILKSDQWSRIGALWDDAARDDFVRACHRLKGTIYSMNITIDFGLPRSAPR